MHIHIHGWKGCRVESSPSNCVPRTKNKIIVPHNTQQSHPTHPKKIDFLFFGRNASVRKCQPIHFPPSTTTRLSVSLSLPLRWLCYFYVLCTTSIPADDDFLVSQLPNYSLALHMCLRRREEKTRKEKKCSPAITVSIKRSEWCRASERGDGKHQPKKKLSQVRPCIVCLFHGSPCSTRLSLSLNPFQPITLCSFPFFPCSSDTIRAVCTMKQEIEPFPVVCLFYCLPYSRIVFFFSLFDCVPVLPSFLLALYKRPSSILFFFFLFFLFSYTLKNKQIKAPLPNKLVTQQGPASTPLTHLLYKHVQPHACRPKDPSPCLHGPYPRRGLCQQLPPQRLLLQRLGRVCQERCRQARAVCEIHVQRRKDFLFIVTLSLHIFGQIREQTALVFVVCSCLSLPASVSRLPLYSLFLCFCMLHFGYAYVCLSVAIVVDRGTDTPLSRSFSCLLALTKQRSGSLFWLLDCLLALPASCNLQAKKKEMAKGEEAETKKERERVNAGLWKINWSIHPSNMYTLTHSLHSTNCLSLVNLNRLSARPPL